MALVFLYFYYTIFFAGWEDLISVSLELPKKELERFLVSIPLETDEQKDIAAKILAADEKVQSEINYMKKLENVKQGLVNDLLSGNVDVGKLK